MAFKIAEAYVEVDADGSKVPGKVANDIDSNSGPLTNSGKGIGSKIAGGIVGGFVALGIGEKIGAFISTGIAGASDLNETLSKSRAIFGENAGALESWASKASTTVGLTKGAALAAASSFGDMFTQIGFTGDAAADMSTSVVQAAADLGSFSNLETADVADRISAAFRGEYDSLQAVIPNINAARVESEALAATGKKTAAELTAQEKATAVLAIINKDGARAMGDFARTSDGYANQQKTAAAQTEELATKVGGMVLPALTEMQGFLISNVIPAVSGFVDWLGQNGAVLGTVATVLGIAGAAWLAYNAVVLATKIPLMAATAAQWAMNIAMSANPVGLVVAAIVALIAIIIALVMNWDAVVAFLTDVWNGFVTWFTGVMDGFFAWWNELWQGISDWIVGVWEGFIGWIRDAFLGYYSWLRGLGSAIVSWWTGLWQGIANFVSNTWTGFINFVRNAFLGYYSWLRGIGAGIVSWWSGLWRGIGSFFSTTFSNIVNFGRTALGNLVGFFTSLPGRIGNALSGAARWLVNVGRDIVAGLWRGIENAWSNLVSWFSGLFDDLIGIAKNILGIASPSLVFDKEVGEMIPAGVERGVESGKRSLNESIRGLVEVPVVPTAAAGFGIGRNAEGGMVVQIGSITIDASSIDEFVDIIEMVKALPQVARGGRGATVGG